MPTPTSHPRPVQYSPARSELHRAIWAVSNSLRGSMGVNSQTFQSCILTLLFYRFLGESVTGHIDGLMREVGNDDFGYALREDRWLIRSVPFRNIRDGFVESHGFFLLPSQLPQNVLASCHDGGDNGEEKLCDRLSRTFSEIEASADGTAAAGTLSGLLTAIDLSSSRLGPTPAARDSAVRRMLEGILSMGLDAGDAGGDALDVFGDAYEFLMSMFASNGGRSGGEYFTPREVSRLLALLATHGKDDVNGVYDPTCGSGSLLLQVVSVLGDNHVGLVAGQEINPTTFALCRMNCILHGLSPDRFDIRLGDTLTEPRHWADGMRAWDAVVSNPPYGISWVGKDDPSLAADERFSPAGVLAPKGNADMAFVMHCVSSLSDEGTAAIVCFPGILYRRGAEQRIRRHLVEEGLVDAVIQLPGRLFFGTGIATSILVLSGGGGGAGRRPSHSWMRAGSTSGHGTTTGCRRRTYRRSSAGPRAGRARTGMRTSPIGSATYLSTR